MWKTKDSEFFAQQGYVMDTCTTNKTAWEIPDEIIAALALLRAAFEAAFHKITQKKARTSGDVLDHREKRDAYQAALQPFAKQYIVDNPLVPDKNKEEMGFPPRKAATPRGKIEQVPFFQAVAAASGDVIFRFRSTEDASKCSILRLADGAEIRYILLGPDDPMPTDPDGNLKSVISKKAIFIVSCGAKNSGKEFWAFARWVNLSTPANSGNWSKSIHITLA